MASLNSKTEYKPNHSYYFISPTPGMVADDVAVGEGGVCKSNNIRFILNVLPGTVLISLGFEHGHVFMSQDFGHKFKNGFVGITIFSDLTTSTTSTTTTTTSDFRLATKQEYKSSELSSTPAENDLYSSETINVSNSYHMSHVTTL